MIINSYQIDQILPLVIHCFICTLLEYCPALQSDQLIDSRALLAQTHFLFLGIKLSVLSRLHERSFRLVAMKKVYEGFLVSSIL